MWSSARHDAHSYRPGNVPWAGDNICDASNLQSLPCSRQSDEFISIFQHQRQKDARLAGNRLIIIYGSVNPRPQPGARKIRL